MIENQAELENLVGNGAIVREDLQKAALAGTGDQGGVGREGRSKP